ncbi:T9SS type A sorting domain-containing protein [Hymenobacter puniceus]|uniref:T9SS type A sorting domain-containing protein n=1 Tax=Hymenobacter sp. BT190 TaxID=2763505 RepID=UPI001651942D|nr:T9SS type A sorting domain-containing protein [Hymenobacter sp. BT190]MBC6699279.1 T9SS type A sorting domain-containing protein [Hymenobacter sp. BT190]
MAQDLRSLSADPGRTPAKAGSATAQRGQALALPFFDDFTTPLDGAPKATNWLPAGGVLVNNRFPVAPPTRGVATFDGLQANGRPYGSGYSDTDTLVSQPIDLSGRTAADRLYLGFYWQAGNIFRRPSANASTAAVQLQLEFKDQNGLWVPVWTRRSDGTREAFRRKFVVIDQARFLHGSFQFRFRAKGSLANNDDSWSIDYVKLAPVRVRADSLFQDVATSRPLSSLLARGTAMPVGQYNAAANPTAQLNPATFTTINNLSDSGFPVPGRWVGQLDVLPGGPSALFRTTDFFSLVSPQFQVRIEGDLRSSPLPISAAPKTVRHRLTLITNETNTDPRTLPNDTISRLTELSDYFAYDDGTAEANVSVPPSTQTQSYYALRFELNKPDQVRSIRISPSFPSAAGRTITVNVWDADPANNGAPTRLPKATQSVQIPASLPAGQTFLEVPFPTPVPVSGRFYAGYGHGLITTPLSINIDLNNVPQADAFWQFTSNFWEPKSTASLDTPPQYEGWALMLRPVMTNTVLRTAPESVAAAFSLYPNPASRGQVQVQGRYAHALVLDALGRVAWQQPASQLGQPMLNLHSLPAGIYLVQLTLADGLTVTKRLILTN